ncbi:MAG: ferrous iron transport protein B [Cytophagales bacterium]|nr:MAG: ferrous iron transport protein B [Cytophagales bacterium]TAF61504.1 MAG: ferrous iron transport protein B [Cytophagales bacterium]
MTINQTIQIALVGNPNSGKTSIFNRMTGLSQKVGNFPGVTVERKEGLLSLPDGTTCSVVDLPGTYSLHPNSPDERVVLQFLAQSLEPSKTQQPHPKTIILYIADLTNLQRHLLLFSQVASLGLEMALGITMGDLAEEKNLLFDKNKLAEKLGVPVFMFNGRNGEGLEALRHWVQNLSPNARPANIWFEANRLAPEFVNELQQNLQTSNPYLALLKAQHTEVFSDLNTTQSQAIEAAWQRHQVKKLTLQIQETLARFGQIAPIVQAVLTQKNAPLAASFTGRVDRILTHKIWGTLLFLGLLLLIFQATFDWATYPMDAIESLFAWLSGWIHETLPDGLLANFLADGVLAGLGGIVVFVPQIAILFCFIAILEEVGYMARAVYLSDSLMRRFGLNGRSIVSIFSGMACAIPAIMATRTISNWRERLISILVTPFVSCSARIPVYTVLVALVVPAETSWFFFNAQGLILLGLYLLGIFTALFAAYVLRFFIPATDMSLLTMELPVYRPPIWSNVLFMVWAKVKDFLWEAGKVILGISILLWFMASFGPGNSIADAENDIKIRLQNSPDSSKLPSILAAARLEKSYVGHVGKAIEPLIEPLGFDWKIGIALLSSFAAREVFIGTLATIYAIGSEENSEEGVRSRMAKDINAKTQKPVYTVATSVGLMLFYAFAMQCMSTFAVVRRETNTWRYPILQFISMTALAYLSSLFVYQCFG